MSRKPTPKGTRPKPKAVLRLPDLDQAKSAVLNSLSSTDAQRGYRHAIDEFRLFRRVNKKRKAWSEGLTEKAVWHVVRESARQAGIEMLAPHDLRRTCARLCHAAGGELEQIQFLLGHIYIQTTERYLGCKQRIQGAANDKIGIEPSG